MPINKIILIITSIILVAILHSVAITESYTEFRPGAITTTGKVILESKNIYHPPEIFGMEILREDIGFLYIIFIQSVPGLI